MQKQIISIYLNKTDQKYQFERKCMRGFVCTHERTLLDRMMTSPSLYQVVHMVPAMMANALHSSVMRMILPNQAKYYDTDQQVKNRSSVLLLYRTTSPSHLRRQGFLRTIVSHQSEIKTTGHLTSKKSVRESNTQGSRNVRR